MNNIKVGLVDDHVLLRSGLASIVENFGYTVQSQYSNGKQLVEKLDKENAPDVFLMDINMPEMDGFETTLWLRDHCPLVNVLALSMYDDETSIIRMIRNGAKGYILKDANPEELKRGIDEVVNHGFYYTDQVTRRVIRRIRDDQDDNADGLSTREIEFLKLACTEMTYKEIAAEMHLSPRTIDGYRDQLFEKLNVKSRVGLVMFAIKNGIVRMN